MIVNIDVRNKAEIIRITVLPAKAMWPNLWEQFLYKNAVAFICIKCKSFFHYLIQLTKIVNSMKQFKLQYKLNKSM